MPGVYIFFQETFHTHKTPFKGTSGFSYDCSGLPRLLQL